MRSSLCTICLAFLCSTIACDNASAQGALARLPGRTLKYIPRMLPRGAMSFGKDVKRIPIHPGIHYFDSDVFKSSWPIYDMHPSIQERNPWIIQHLNNSPSIRSIDIEYYTFIAGLNKKLEPVGPEMFRISGVDERSVSDFLRDLGVPSQSASVQPYLVVKLGEHYWLVKEPRPPPFTGLGGILNPEPPIGGHIPFSGNFMDDLPPLGGEELGILKVGTFNTQGRSSSNTSGPEYSDTGSTYSDFKPNFHQSPPIHSTTLNPPCGIVARVFLTRIQVFNIYNNDEEEGMRLQAEPDYESGVYILD